MGFLKCHKLSTWFFVIDKETKKVVHSVPYESGGVSVFSPIADDKAQAIFEELKSKYPIDKYEIEVSTHKVD